MLANLFNSWDIIQYGIQGFLIPVVEFCKFFFTMPMLPFTMLGILGFFIKKKSFR